VVVRSRNDDLSLRPGMTGYVAVNVAEVRGVLRLPNAALRYEPEPGSAALAASSGARSAVSRAGGHSNQRTLWRLRPDGQAEAVHVTLGVADARHTQLVAGALKNGDALVIGERLPGGFAGPRLF
jgi:HlyD family secretion protein